MTTTKKASRAYLYVLYVASMGFAALGLLGAVFRGVRPSFYTPEFFTSILIVLSTSAFVYLLRKTEEISADHSELKSLLKGRAVLTMESQDALFESLLQATTQSREVYTHMMSEPPHLLPAKAPTHYFDSIHRHLRERDTTTIFNRIAAVNSPAKARWILDTLILLKDVRSFSLAVRYIEDVAPLTTIHVCLNGADSAVFVWPTVDSDGSGQGFRVLDIAAAKAMKGEHQREFERALALKKGPEWRWTNLEKFASRYPELGPVLAELKSQVLRK